MAIAGAQIRRQFLDYFAARGHQVLPSSSLIPHGNPTMLLTTAGMVQFMPYYLGQKKPPQPRATTVQKCFRTVDIEEVGRTLRHLTFFEMLGNFSFGDYFKREAIRLAFELLTQGYGMQPGRLWATVHTEDDEAHQLWLSETPIPNERIRRFGDEANLWAPGPTGPCGPSSEIFYDRGPKTGCGRPDCGPNCEHCERYLEIWNLVFIQYDRDESGRRIRLTRPGVDTGMGLERLTCALNGKNSLFETDIFIPLVEHWRAATGATDPQHLSLRVLADHSRGATMLIGDGVTPSNEGRGYVLRRLIRRAMLHARRLDPPGRPSLADAVPIVVEILGDTYPELLPNVERIRETLRAEEERFEAALKQGMERLTILLHRGHLTAEETFYLHDTLGFPMELSAELARDRGITVDLEGARGLMEAQRHRSRAAATFELPMPSAPTRFVGYEQLEADTQVTEVFPVPDQAGAADVYLAETPFYAERGGQSADRGWLEWGGERVEVTDVQVQAESIRHRVPTRPAAIPAGTRLRARVDPARRTALARLHSATHLLHRALRDVLGEQAQQAGSLVEPDYATFDFRFPRALTPVELEQVEKLLNEKIRANLSRRVEDLPLQEAIDTGAVALFDEKYGERVRVVAFGDWSRELCGGTHVERSGDIGLALISRDRSIGAGTRRIEMWAAAAAEERVRLYTQTIERLGGTLKSTPEQLVGKVEALQGEVRRLQKDLDQARQKLAAGAAAAPEPAEEIGGVPVAIRQVDAGDTRDLRRFADAALNRLGTPGVAVVLNRDRVVVKVSPPLVARGFHAGKICEAIAGAAGGRGGGRPDLAEGGGLQPGRRPAALAAARAVLSAMAGDK
jgi:alanyl-tRNA synthetase